MKCILNVYETKGSYKTIQLHLEHNPSIKFLSRFKYPSKDFDISIISNILITILNDKY